MRAREDAGFHQTVMPEKYSRVFPWAAYPWAVLLPALGAPAQPVLLTTQHVDLRIRYKPDVQPVLDIVVTDEDARPARDLASTNCVLLVAEAARLELPGDIPPLGFGGDSVWVLPASQREGILYLGMSAGGNPFGVFDGSLSVKLRSVEGPGHFFLWQAELGGLRFWMNSKDGLGEDDFFSQPVGGHGHFDWGFSTSGVYRLTFQAEGRRVGETTNVTSDLLPFTFHVLPLPPAVPSPFRKWQEQYWPGETDSAQADAGSDPDGDGLLNLWEYALGRVPKNHDPSPLPGLSWARSGDGAGDLFSLRLARSKSATDLVYRLERAMLPRGPWSLDPTSPKLETGSPSMDVVTWAVSGTSDGGAVGFYRVQVELEDQL